MQNCYIDNWHEFQVKVARLFRRIPRCKAYIDHSMKGTRIENVNIDVYVEFTPLLQIVDAHHSSHSNLVFKVIVECKYWKRKVPQEKVFALKTIVEDMGAAMGIFVTEKGVQQGAEKYLDSKSGLMAVTLDELELMIHGIEIARKFEREMHPALCRDCGRETEVPFLPSVYCRDCYLKRRRKY